MSGYNFPEYGCIAEKIMKHNGAFLPLGEEALRFSTPLTMSMLGSKISESGISLRQYYEGLGIKIGRQSVTRPGWHHCILPQGWNVTYYNGGGEIITYRDAKGKHLFHLITRKRPNDGKCLLCGIEVNYS